MGDDRVPLAILLRGRVGMMMIPIDIPPKFKSLAVQVLPCLPPGTLHPVVMPFDPPSTTPICLLASMSHTQQDRESALDDVGPHKVRNMVMEIRGRGPRRQVPAIQIDPDSDMTPLNMMIAMENPTVLLPTVKAIIGGHDFFLTSKALFDEFQSMREIPLPTE